MQRISGLLLHRMRVSRSTAVPRHAPCIDAHFIQSATPEGIEYFTPRDLGPEDSAGQNRIETPTPPPTGVVHLSQLGSQWADYDIMSETVEGTTGQKRSLDPSDSQSSQLLLRPGPFVLRF